MEGHGPHDAVRLENARAAMWGECGRQLIAGEKTSFQIQS
jgi:hypothetical protein